MRVLVCGSRTFGAVYNEHGTRIGTKDPDGIVESVIFGLCYGEPSTIIEGEADGADSIGKMVAERFGFGPDPYPADWDKHGRAAGPIRNQQMLDEGKPELVVAFVDKPLAESRGTADMVRRARKAGLPVYVVEKIQ